MIRKGRRGDTSNFGENNPRSKLTDRDIPIIIKSYEHGFSLTYIARMFNVTKQNIASIVKRKTWKHIIISRRISH
jgi:hypothetical protein